MATQLQVRWPCLAGTRPASLDGRSVPLLQFGPALVLACWINSTRAQGPRLSVRSYLQRRNTKRLIALWFSRFERFCCRIALHCRSTAIRAGTQAAVCVREVCAQATRTTRSGAPNDATVRWTAAGLPCLPDDVQPRQLLQEHEIAPQDKRSVLRVGGKQGLREAEEVPPEPTQKVRGLCGRDS